jgi:hypothetical protein
VQLEVVQVHQYLWGSRDTIIDGLGVGWEGHPSGVRRKARGLCKYTVSTQEGLDSSKICSVITLMNDDL